MSLKQWNARKLMQKLQIIIYLHQDGNSQVNIAQKAGCLLKFVKGVTRKWNETGAQSARLDLARLVRVVSNKIVHL